MQMLLLVLVQLSKYDVFLHVFCKSVKMFIGCLCCLCLSYGFVILKVEIVIGLDEEYGLNIEDDNSENITSIQEVANLTEKMI